MRKTLISIVLLSACTDQAVGPVITPSVPEDRIPPRLLVETPLRGTVQPGDATSVEVTGRVEDDQPGVRVSVNGQAVWLGPDGSWKVTVPAGTGMTFIHTTAIDRRGNTATDTRAVLGGELVSAATPVTDGIVVRLDARAVRLAGDVAAGRLAAVDLGERLQRHNPILDNPIPCVTKRAELGAFTHGAVRMQLWPIDGGLGVDAEIADVRADLDVRFSDSCTTTRTGAATARSSRFRFFGRLRLGLDADGQVVANRDEIDAYFDDLDIEGAIPNGLARDLEDLLSTNLGELVAGEVAGHVPSAVLSGLGEGDRAVEVGGHTLQIVLRPTELQFDIHGVSIAVDSSVSIAGAYAPIVVSSSQRPWIDRARALSVGLADDVLNQFVSSLWSAGQLDRDLPAGTFAGIDFDSVRLSPRLPPVLEALPGGGGLRLWVGDVECQYVHGNETVARLSLSAEITLGVGASQGRLTVVPFGQKLYVDELRDTLATPTLVGRALDEAGQLASESLLTSLGAVLEHVPLPASAGVMQITSQAWGVTPENGYLLMTGD